MEYKALYIKSGTNEMLIKKGNEMNTCGPCIDPCWTPLGDEVQSSATKLV